LIRGLASGQQLLRDRDHDVLRRSSAAAFHARAGEEEAKIEIRSGEIAAELETNWELVSAGKPPKKVEPLL
jgi:hypothetical protein